MNKPKLIKKEDISPEHKFSRKGRKNRKPAPSPTQQVVKATTEWLQSRQEKPSAREAFAALFNEPKTQSA
ncbi:MAG TPA: hypothetical protein VEF04_02995 [Blastocatellia bacterium]|nr:hypothetical protein [Blastocatellia bacterium]